MTPDQHMRNARSTYESFLHLMRNGAIASVVVAAFVIVLISHHH